MSAAEKRPVASEEENKKLVHAWAHQMRRELPKDHPAQATLTAVIRHNFVPPFPVAKPPGDFVPTVRRDRSGEVVAWATIGAALFTLGGAALPSLSWAITCALLGALALTLAFDRSDAA
jgi:hypothetical protein